MLVTLAGVSCGPVANFRPASGLMPDRSLEVGAGIARVSQRPYVDEPSASAGQAWVTGEVAEHRVALSAISAFDSDALGIGGALRVNAIRSDRFHGGIEGEAGYLWLALSLPVALRVLDQSYLYAGPRLFNWSVELAFGIPVGSSVRVYDGLIVRAEWQRSWQNFKYYNRRDHLGAAAAFQF
jgi:hypothetical protein